MVSPFFLDPFLALYFYMFLFLFETNAKKDSLFTRKLSVMVRVCKDNKNPCSGHAG